MLRDVEQPEFFACDCYSDEHTLRFQYIKDDEDPLFSEVYTSVYVGSPGPWWKRLWAFIKYVFGHRCKYGDFDCFVLRRADLDRMIRMLEAYKNDMEEEPETQ
jgi:hypothetical protein